MKKNDEKQGINSSIAETMQALEGVRTEIDDLDNQILKLLNDRIQCVMEVKKIKMENNFAIVDESRQERILQRLKSKIDEEHHDYIDLIYEIIFRYSYELQQ